MRDRGRHFETEKISKATRNSPNLTEATKSNEILSDSFQRE